MSRAPAYAYRVLLLALSLSLLAPVAAASADEATQSPYLWNAMVSGGSSVLVHGGIVYVTDRTNTLLAYRVRCGRGGATCSPVWKARLPKGTGYSATVAGSGNHIYVSVSGDRLYAFPTACRNGTRRCRALWSAIPEAPSIPGNRIDGAGDITSAVSSEGVLYVTSALPLEERPDLDPSRLYAYPASCPSADRDCPPLWRSPALHGAMKPVAVDGRIYVATSYGLTVFPVGCRTDGGICAPLFVGRQGPRFRGQSMSEPVVTDDMAYVTTDRPYMGADGPLPRLNAYSVDCRTDGRVCHPAWTARMRSNWASAPISGGGLLYVSGSRGLYAFSTACGTETTVCRPVWRSRHQEWLASTSEDGSIVFLRGRRRKILAFDAACLARCPPLWTARLEGKGYVESPIEHDGTTYVVVGKSIYAFRTGCRRHHRCRPIWTWAAPYRFGQPVFGDGVMVVSSGRNIYAIREPVRP